MHAVLLCMSKMRGEIEMVQYCSVSNSRRTVCDAKEILIKHTFPPLSSTGTDRKSGGGSTGTSDIIIWSNRSPACSPDTTRVRLEVINLHDTENQSRLHRPVCWPVRPVSVQPACRRDDRGGAAFHPLATARGGRLQSLQGKTGVTLTRLAQEAVSR